MVSIPAVWRNVRAAAPVLVSVSCVVGVVWPFEKIVSPKKKIRAPRVRPSPRRPWRATPGPPEGARWLPGTVVDKGTKPSPEGSNFSHKFGRLSHKSAMPTGTSLAHSAPVKCVLSLPDAAADAAPSSIHIAAGPMQAAVDRRKAFPGQLDWLHARSGSRRADTVGQGLAPRTFVGATADGPA